MRLPTRIHGMLDYAAGLLIMALPWLLGFAAGGAETWVPVAVGGGLLLVSLFTEYELGIVKRIPMPVHLLIDAVGGALLAASPWLFGFDETVWIPHVAAGVFEILTAAVTNTVPSYERRRAAR